MNVKRRTTTREKESNIAWIGTMTKDIILQGEEDNNNMQKKRSNVQRGMQHHEWIGEQYYTKRKWRGKQQLCKKKKRKATSSVKKN